VGSESGTSPLNVLEGSREESAEDLNAELTLRWDGEVERREGGGAAAVDTAFARARLALLAQHSMQQQQQQPAPVGEGVGGGGGSGGVDTAAAFARARLALAAQCSSMEDQQQVAAEVAVNSYPLAPIQGIIIQPGVGISPQLINTPKGGFGAGWIHPGALPLPLPDHTVHLRHYSDQHDSYHHDINNNKLQIQHSDLQPGRASEGSSSSSADVAHVDITTDITHWGDCLGRGSFGAVYKVRNNLFFNILKLYPRG
jgi:hypothetical protein